MKKMLWLVMVMLMTGSVFGQGTNGWQIAEKYDRSFTGWAKGGSMVKGGSVSIDKVTGKMISLSAMRVRMKNSPGEMEVKKTFDIPVAKQGKEIVVEILLGYNFKTDLGDAEAYCSVKALNKRGEQLSLKEISRQKTGGTLQGTSTDMEVNRLVLSSEETKTITAIQVVFRAKTTVWFTDVGMLGKNNKNCIAELWIRSLTIKEQE